MITQEEKAGEMPKRDDENNVEVSQIQELEEQIKQLQDQLLRSMAETENVRTRYSKELEESRKYAISAFAKDLTSVLENLYRSTDFLTEDHLQNEEISKIYSGIKMTQDEFIKILEHQGVKRIAPKAGEKFDHNYHQAISTVQQPGVEENSIVTVIQSGYTLNGRLIKPAMVIVSAEA